MRRTNEIFKKKGKLTSKSVIGTYIRTMNMTQYRDYHYADSDRLNFADRKNQQEAEAAHAKQEEAEAELLERLEKGEISQAEYSTLSATTTEAAIAAVNPGFMVGVTPPDNTALLEQLSEEDYQYLNLK